MKSVLDGLDRGHVALLLLDDTVHGNGLTAFTSGALTQLRRNAFRNLRLTFDMIVCVFRLKINMNYVFINVE